MLRDFPRIWLLLLAPDVRIETIGRVHLMDGFAIEDALQKVAERVVDAEIEIVLGG